MLSLTCLGSGSNGNCYLLASENETLIIEVGVNFNKSLRPMLRGRIENVVGVLVSHEHQDHSHYVKSLLNLNRDVYTSLGTAIALGIDEHRKVHTLKHLRPTEIGSFTVLPFNVHHDCAEPIGFKIEHPDCKPIVFLTDTRYTEFTFENIGTLIVEANYCPTLLKQGYKQNHLTKKQYDRTRNNHCSIDTACNIIAASASNIHKVLLIHLSNDWSSIVDFIHKAQSHTSAVVEAIDTTDDYFETIIF